MVGTLRFAHPTIPIQLSKGALVIASEAKQSMVRARLWIASSLRSSQ
jgi:hypothetical protein